MSEARRFIFVAGSSAKFWEIEVDRASVTVRFGALGRDPQTKTRTLESEAKAIAERDKLVKKKIAEGYREEGSEEPASWPRVAWDDKTRALVHPRRASNIAPKKVDVAKAWKMARAAFDEKTREAVKKGRRVKDLTPEDRAHMDAAAKTFDEDAPPDVGDPIVEAFRGLLIAIHGHHVNTPPAIRKAHDALVAMWCAKYGVAFATEAMIQTFRHARVEISSVYVSHCHPDNIGMFSNIVNGDTSPWDVLRAHLAACCATDYARARAAAEAARPHGRDIFRAAIAFVFPDEAAWAREALTECTYERWVYVFGQPLISCFTDESTIRTFFEYRSVRFEFLYDVIDALGTNAFPLFAAHYGSGTWRDKAAQKRFFTAMTIIESDEALAWVKRQRHDQVVGPLAEAYLIRTGR